MRALTWFRTCLALTALLVPVLPALAYVNGGTRITTIKKYPNEMSSAGWSICCGWEAGTSADGKQTNQLVVGALGRLSAEDLKKVSVEDRQALAKAADEALEKGRVDEGKIGALKYRVGTYRYETYWETDYEKEGKQIHARKTYSVPFVAIKLIAE